MTILQIILEGTLKSIRWRIFRKVYQDTRNRVLNITEETEPDMTKKKMKVKK